MNDEFCRLVHCNVSKYYETCARNYQGECFIVEMCKHHSFDYMCNVRFINDIKLFKKYYMLAKLSE